jgi:hypothetical protein
MATGLGGGEGMNIPINSMRPKSNSMNFFQKQLFIQNIGIQHNQILLRPTAFMKHILYSELLGFWTFHPPVFCVAYVMKHKKIKSKSFVNIRLF